MSKVVGRIEWASYFKAAARMYGWTHAQILDLTPLQLFEYLQEDVSTQEQPKFRSMEAAFASLQARRELGL